MTKSNITPITLTTSVTPVTYSADNINHYIHSGWQKVCTVHNATSYGNEWFYKDIDTSLMYSNHRSWVYAITVNDYIVKIGETGQPLGISKNYSSQPITGTKSRLGRYARHKASSTNTIGDTDETIRTALVEETKSPDYTVAFYAYKCEEAVQKIVLGNTVIHCKAQVHKDYEKKFLDYYKDNVGTYPELNAGRA